MDETKGNTLEAAKDFVAGDELLTVRHSPYSILPSAITLLFHPDHCAIFSRVCRFFAEFRSARLPDNTGEPCAARLSQWLCGVQ